MLAESTWLSASDFLNTNKKIASKNFLFSLLFHVIFAALVFLCLIEPRLALKKNEIEVEIIQTLPRSKFVVESFSKHSLTTKKLVRRNIPLSALGIKISTSPTTTTQNDIQASVERFESTEGITDFKQADKDLNLHQHIYETIDRGLTYPTELAERRMEGSVRATIWFSENGELIPSKTQLDSNSNYLKIVVAQALRRAFREPIPKSKFKGTEPISVRCTFTFEITEHNDASIVASKKKLLGNRLSFYRNYQKSALQWDLGPLHGLGPIPQVDVLWLPEKIGELFSKKAKIDPLDKYRDDPEW